jgi:hypothetical protein
MIANSCLEKCGEMFAKVTNLKAFMKNLKADEIRGFGV